MVALKTKIFLNGGSMKCIIPKSIVEAANLKHKETLLIDVDDTGTIVMRKLTLKEQISNELLTV